MTKSSKKQTPYTFTGVAECSALKIVVNFLAADNVAMPARLFMMPLIVVEAKKAMIEHNAMGSFFWYFKTKDRSNVDGTQYEITIVPRQIEKLKVKMIVI